jgi:iron complex transport system substrate-binding protein
VCALGFERELVGRSHECDYPPSVARLPSLTEPKFRPEGSSVEIDRAVKTIVRESLSVYRVDADRLKVLRPDVIVTQSQCEVCAVSEDEVARAVDDWVGTRPRIVSLAPVALAGVLGDVERVGAALGAPARGRELSERLRGRIEAIAARGRAADVKPTVACIEWLEPLMAAGNWMPELVEMAGGVNLFGEAGKHSPWMTFDELARNDPDVIFIAPCGFGIERTLADLPALTRHPGWNDLKAVRARKVIVADGNQYFNRPGPRIVESLEILAEALGPGRFHFGREGSGWRRL